MYQRRSSVIPVLLICAAMSGANPPQAPRTAETKAAGIMFDHDRKNHWMTIKIDGDKEPTKFLIDPSNKNLEKSLATVFNASRVRIISRTEGENRRLVAIQRQILQETGTMTGEVVKVHNDFWVEVKPKKGLANAFAPGANFNDKAFMARLKSLKPGDSVTIQYMTDFERHRILKLRKNNSEEQVEARTQK